MNPRSEPLLWLQLVALGAIPLELLGLLLVLAGAEPGPLPALERLLAWAIGALGPAILLWQRPADVCSLVLVQVPIRARSEAQRCLAALQSPLPAQLAMALGAAGLLPLFWWMDQHAALAAPLSPLAASPRVVGLLLACPLLALILWQWQQLIQAIALLSRRPDAIAARAPLSSAQLETQRLCLGLPLLLLSPLQISATPAPQPQPEPKPVSTPWQPEQGQGPEPEQGGASVSAPEPEQAQERKQDLGLELELEHKQAEWPASETGSDLPHVFDTPQPGSEPNRQGRLHEEEQPPSHPEASVAGSVAIDPEQAAEQAEGADLDEEIG